MWLIRIVGRPLRLAPHHAPGQESGPAMRRYRSCNIICVGVKKDASAIRKLLDLPARDSEIISLSINGG